MTCKAIKAKAGGAMKAIVSLLLLLTVNLTAHAQLSIPRWPAEQGMEPSADFAVSVRTSLDTVWHEVQTMHCEVNLRNRTKASFAEFDMEGTAYVRVRLLKEDADLRRASVVVRPLSRQVRHKVIDARTLELQLDSAAYLSVELNGDRMHNLHLFANPLLQETHDVGEPLCLDWRGEAAHDVFVKDARLIYFAPGVHRPKDLPSGDIRIPSNCTVYLAPGAIVKARLVVDKAENVRIVGRGIIMHALRGVEITHSRNVLVDGITFLNPQHYTIFGGDSEDITIRHIKSFSARSWSDGIDLMCCRNVLIEDVFMRNSDDCIALYNHRWWYWGGSENIRVNRATLWADVAHPINIGTHGDDRSEEGEVLSDVVFNDCDILYARTNAAISIACGDKNHLRDITFRRIRIEQIYDTALFGIGVIYSAKYNRAPGNTIRNIRFEEMSFTGETTMLKPSWIKDYDGHQRAEEVSFHELSINGKKIVSQDLMGNNGL